MKRADSASWLPVPALLALGIALVALGKKLWP